MTCKIVPEMTYNVSSGTLSLYTTTTTCVLAGVCKPWGTCHYVNVLRCMHTLMSVKQILYIIGLLTVWLVYLVCVCVCMLLFDVNLLVYLCSDCVGCSILSPETYRT